MAQTSLCSLASSNLFFFILVGTFIKRGLAYDALFVFGDSYADTGNHDKLDSGINLIGEANNRPWREPYGMTWPRFPFGRYSNGRVFTDVYASRLNVAPPIPYNILNITTINHSNNNTNSSQGLWVGINFAYGGAGLFSSSGQNYPTIGKQIQQLEKLIDDGIVSKELIAKSICVIVFAGVDYRLFLAGNSLNSINTFIKKVTDEIGIEVEALYQLGFNAIAVTNLEPVGCLPLATYSNNFTSCNETINFALSVPHNLQLQFKIAGLQLNHPTTKFIVIDFYTAFQIAIGANFPLRPCCQGINGALCGAIDNNGAPLYKICPSPQRSLFWDLSHPTDIGWARISNVALAFV